MQVDSYRRKNHRLNHEHVSVLVKAGQSVSNLPPQVKNTVGDLELWKSFELDPNEPRIGLDTKEAIADIEKQGYHVSRVVVTTTEGDLPAGRP